jgi:hypothetical protein
MSRKLLFVAFTLVCITSFTVPTNAQSPYFATGSWSPPVLAPNCNGVQGFDGPMICYTTTITCPDPSNPGHNIDDLGLIFGYENPAGNTNKGTIVVFPGGSGQAPATLTTELSFVQFYKSQGYEMIQLAWDGAWEDTRFPIPPDTFGNIQIAACRQATFLKFVHSSTAVTLQTPVVLYQTGTGMCAQGSSAGSAAVAYAMTWYGAADATTGFLDNVELLAGPPLSRVDQGCQAPAANNVVVCGTNDSIPACKGWPTGGTSLSPTYISPAINGVRQWTNISQCAASGGNTNLWNPVWDNMSILSPTVTGQQLNYPKTSIGAWLCDTTTGAAMNNTTPEGYLYYQSITPMNEFFSVNAIYDCVSAEGVADGYNTPDVGNHNPSTEGITLIENHMVTSCTKH